MKKFTLMKIFKIFKVQFFKFYNRNYNKLKIFFFQCEFYMHFNKNKFTIKNSEIL